MTRRINARIDEDLALKLEQLSALTGKSTSAILKAALEAYYAQVRESSQGAKALLLAEGFIGCAEGPTDLSSSYKEELLRSWSNKA